MKTGGAPLEVFDGGLARPASNLGLKLVREAYGTVDLLPEIAGFVVVAWDFRGDYVPAYDMHPNSPFGQIFVPGFVAEMLRTEFRRQELGLIGLDPA